MNEPPLPIGRWRRFRRFVTYVGIRLFLLFLRVQPLSWARAWGAFFAWLVYGLARRERRRTQEQLASAFPEVDDHQRRRWARACFLHLGRSAAEVAQVDRIRRRFGSFVELDPAGRESLDAALREGRGVLVVSGHVGNWELLGFYLAWAGYPVRTLARGHSDARLSAFIRRYRHSRGVRTILRGEEGASRAMIQAFRDSALLGFFIDQDTDVAGEFVPFFGRLAWTPRGAAVLALRTEAPVVVATLSRLPDGRHRLSVVRYHPPTDGERDDRVRRVTADLTALIERAIRRCPPQWVWMHKRWRRQPSASS